VHQTVCEKPKWVNWELMGGFFIAAIHHALRKQVADMRKAVAPFSLKVASQTFIRRDGISAMERLLP